MVINFVSWISMPYWKYAVLALIIAPEITIKTTKNEDK